jgi:IclR family KDG regulon transcriptional repressor
MSKPAKSLSGVPPSAEKATGTAAFSKFMAVLQIIADAPKPLTIAQITERSRYPRTTVYRILGALITEGLVSESLQSGAYSLGARLLSLASQSWERFDIRLVAADPLHRLREMTQETVHLAVRSGTGMVYIEKLESPHAVRMASRVGTRVTLYSSSVGKAYLAALDQATRDALLQGITFERFTRNSITSKPALDAELEATKRRGYAEDREENEENIFCYGAAITGPTGEPVACVSISIPTFRLSSSPLETYLQPLKIACNAISAQIGPAALASE